MTNEKLVFWYRLPDGCNENKHFIKALESQGFEDVKVTNSSCIGSEVMWFDGSPSTFSVCFEAIKNNKKANGKITSGYKLATVVEYKHE